MQIQSQKQSLQHQDQKGFTLIEVTISMVLMAIVGLGVLSLFAYAANNTQTVADREMASAVAQQRMEQLRSVEFVDATLNATGSAGTALDITRLGRTYRVVTIIADSEVVNSRVTLKTITVSVTPVSSNAKWATNTTSLFSSVTLMTERSAQGTGPNRAL
jgi:prepilin-type N-terminal cleavage/methylation domain-containing protein